MKYLLSPIFILALSTWSHAQVAEKIIRNGKIYTADDSQPFVEAIAIKDGIFIFVGSNADAEKHIGAITVVEDLNGRIILPGLHDVHMHPLEAGSPVGGDCALDSQEVDPEKLGIALRDCNLSSNSNGWIISSGHSIYTLLDATRDPKDILDDYYPDEPMVVMEETSHSVWVNSKALEELNITSSTADPLGGHILKNESTGEPNGILMDNAGDAALSAALASNTTLDELNYQGLVEYSLPLIAQSGITSICEGRTYWKRNYINIWKRIKNEGLLTARVNLAPWVYPNDDDSAQIPQLQNLYEEGDDMLRVNQIKLYSDGIIINATSAMHEPYLDNLGLPFNRGLNYIEVNRLAQLIAALEPVGFDFHIHAIGDRGVTEGIDAIETARNINGDIGARHRITHVEIVKPTDYARFAPLNITADMQVAGDFSNPEHWDENNFLIGSDRTQNIIPLKSIFDADARVTLSSDWDVSDVNPFVGIQNAVTRSPEQLPSVEEAVKSYTIRAAYVMRQENNTGSIEVNKWADFICVDQDIFTIDPSQINTTKVLSTHLGGEEIFRSSILSTKNTAQKKRKIEIQENPVDDILRIIQGPLIPDSASIFASDGKLIKELVIRNSTSDHFEINVSNLPTGAYYIQVQFIHGGLGVASFVKN